MLQSVSQKAAVRAESLSPADGSAQNSESTSEHRMQRGNPGAQERGEATHRTDLERFLGDSSLRTLPPGPKPRIQAVSSVATVSQADKDRDPVEHIRVLASDAMEGRGSPSEGLNKAAEYIVKMMERYGVEGANPGDPANPYYQTFSMFRFGPDVHEHPGVEAGTPTLEDRHRLFETGFALSPDMPAEDLQLIHERIKEMDPAKARIFENALRTVGPKQLASALAQEFPMAGAVQNVVGKIEGTGPNKDEVIVVMAHYDHVGKRWGRIYNGADDNASGTAALMSMIPDLVEAQKNGELDRSVVFLFTAAEERGLVGASQFVNNPIPGLELDKIAGVINVDMLGRWQSDRISVANQTGRSENYWGDLVEQANQNMEKPFETVNQDIDGFVNRQDGWVFTRKGEDVAVIFEGLSNPNGGGSMNRDYHKDSDTLEAMLEENGGEKIRQGAKFVLELTKLGANRPKTDSEETD